MHPGSAAAPPANLAHNQHSRPNEACTAWSARLPASRRSSVPLSSHAFKRSRHCRERLASLLRLAPTAHTDPRHLQPTDVVPAKQTSEMHISHLYILLHAATTSVTKDAHTQHVKGNNCLYRLEITPSEQTSTTLQRASTTKHPLQQIAHNQIFLTS